DRPCHRPARERCSRPRRSTGAGSRRIVSLRRALVPWLLIGLAGCGWFGSRGVMEPRGPSLADVVSDLRPIELAEPSEPSPSREEVMAAYRSIYGQVSDPRLDHAVGKRLADLSMSAGEDHAVAGTA